MHGPLSIVCRNFATTEIRRVCTFNRRVLSFMYVQVTLVSIAEYMIYTWNISLNHSHTIFLAAVMWTKGGRGKEKNSIFNDSTFSFFLIFVVLNLFSAFIFWSEQDRQTERDSLEWAGFLLETTRLFVALLSWEYVGLLFCSVLLFSFSDLIVTDTFREEDWG